MFFFIAGIQPKTVDLEGAPRMCPSCGLYQARLKRTDHYLSIFFLPVIRLKKGNPIVECQSCGHIAHESGEPWVKSAQGPDRQCRYCGKPVETSFDFCPYCGKPIF